MTDDTPNPQTTDTQAAKSDPGAKHKHFQHHAAAVSASAKAIGQHVKTLQSMPLTDKQTEVVNALGAETAQLHLAVNNASADEPPAPPNTGGAAQTSAVNPNEDTSD